MSSAEYELRYLEAGLAVLESYLLSGDLYWPIGIKAQRGERPYPLLTLGGLLLSERRAHAFPLTMEQRTRLEQVDTQIDALRSNWRVAWGQKAAVEFRSRLNLWRNFIEEYRDNPEAHFDRYAYEVSRRVQLQLLGQDAEKLSDAETNLLNGLDQYLRAKLNPGEFVWESEIQSGFPLDTFWYLYGTLPPGNNRA